MRRLMSGLSRDDLLDAAIALFIVAVGVGCLYMILTGISQSDAARNRAEEEVVLRGVVLSSNDDNATVFLLYTSSDTVAREGDNVSVPLSLSENSYITMKCHVVSVGTEVWRPQDDAWTEYALVECQIVEQPVRKNSR